MDSDIYIISPGNPDRAKWTQQMWRRFFALYRGVITATPPKPSDSNFERWIETANTTCQKWVQDLTQPDRDKMEKKKVPIASHSLTHTHTPGPSLACTTLVPVGGGPFLR